MLIRILLLSANQRLREQVSDEIIAKHPSVISGIGKNLVLDCMDEVTRDDVIDCLSEGSFEYIDTIEVGEPKPKPQAPPMDNPFKSAYDLK